MNLLVKWLPVNVIIVKELYHFCELQLTEPHCTFVLYYSA